MTRREPWWRTVAKLLFGAALVYLGGSVLLLYAAVTGNGWGYWVGGLVMLAGAGAITRTAWEIRR